jgi:hypothetical protein
MILRRSTLAIRDKLGYVVLKLGHYLVERGEPGSACPRELGQVSVSDLAMTDDSLSGHVGVRDIVGPEFMPWARGGAVEDLSCRASQLAFAEEQSRGTGHVKVFQHCKAGR